MILRSDMNNAVVLYDDTATSKKQGQQEPPTSKKCERESEEEEGRAGTAASRMIIDMCTIKNLFVVPTAGCILAHVVYRHD
jgi:hypothetical protein